MNEILDAPMDLRGLVPPVGKRQDDVIVSVCHRRTVPRKPLAALMICVANCLVRLRSLLFEPSQQSGTKIEADLAVIVNHLSNLLIAVQNSRSSIRRVALGGDSLVPVIKGPRRGLGLDLICPRVFARRLIAMAVDTNVSRRRSFQFSTEYILVA